MCKVLVVDDALFMRKVNIGILRDMGIEDIIEAKDGREAINLYMIHKPDLVLMDITMPEMDGLEALSGIMEIDKKAKVIMCSAMGQTQNVKEAIRLGAKDFIVKPYEKDRVIDTIKNVLG